MKEFTKRSMNGCRSECIQYFYYLKITAISRFRAKIQFTEQYKFKKKKHLIILRRRNIFCIYFMRSKWIDDRYSDVSQSYGEKTPGTYQRANRDWTSLHRRYEISTWGILFSFLFSFFSSYLFVWFTCTFRILWRMVLPFIYRFFTR